MKISVLGTIYEIFFDYEGEDADGETNVFTKEIHVKPTEKLLDSDATDEERDAWSDHVMRHEIIHAYFMESGLLEYCYDETLVDWIATQWTKIARDFEVLGCYED